MSWVSAAEKQLYYYSTMSYTFITIQWEIHYRETKEMMSAQTKLSVDTAKEVQADPTLKSKVSAHSMLA